jgi:hypothetical protein
MSFQRIPPSPEYAGLAWRYVSQMLERPWATLNVEVVSDPAEPVDAGGLSVSERAFQRAIYHELNSTDIPGPRGGRSLPNPDWSIMRGWGQPRYVRPAGLFGIFRRATRRRWVWLTAIPKAEARAAAYARPRGALWIDDYQLQSGGLGSVKARF